MATLPDDQRVALVLRAYHDQDYADIAHATGSTVAAVKSRLHRARRALAAWLGLGDGGAAAGPGPDRGGGAMSDPETPFDAAERRALAAWDAPAPARLRRARPRRPRSRARAPPLRSPRARRGRAARDRARGRRAHRLPRAAEGALAAGAARATAQLGDRGVAVAEPGAALTWREEAGGDAVVEQTGGAVFYRVEPGGAFVVRVPGGECASAGRASTWRSTRWIAWVQRRAGRFSGRPSPPS
ncbi:MAG: sigma-70 region 4 domain-containing protein [Deltaproteobacteria bacterium]|nr:sigma-70 region 4 domain-containing protein [Deltaproteobacteria bacterium]